MPPCGSPISTVPQPRLVLLPGVPAALTAGTHGVCLPTGTGSEAVRPCAEPKADQAAGSGEALLAVRVFQAFPSRVTETVVAAAVSGSRAHPDTRAVPPGCVRMALSPPRA